MYETELKKFPKFLGLNKKYDQGKFFFEYIENFFYFIRIIFSEKIYVSVGMNVNIIYIWPSSLKKEWINRVYTSINLLSTELIVFFSIFFGKKLSSSGGQKHKRTRTYIYTHAGGGYFIE